MTMDLTAKEMFRPGTGRNAHGQYRRGVEEKPLTDRQQSRRDREVARVMAAAAMKHGPADNPDDVIKQKMFLVREGLMSAKEAFARPPYRPGQKA